MIAAAAVLAAATATSPVQLAVEPRVDGQPVAARQLEIAVRSRDGNAPRIVAVARGRAVLELAPGEYDVLVTHGHLPTRPQRVHRIRVAADIWQRLVADVTTHLLTVPSASRIRLTSEGGQSHTLRGACPVRLAAGRYRLQLEPGDDPAGRGDVWSLHLDRDRTLLIHRPGGR